MTIQHLNDHFVGDAIFTFVEAAQTLTNISEVEAALDSRLSGLGIGHFSAFRGAGPNGQIQGQWMRGKINKRWHDQYSSHDFAKKDQLLRHGLEDPNPTTWTQFRLEADLSNDQEMIFQEAAEFGLHDGFYLPIHQLDGSMYGVTMMVPHILETDSRLFAALHMLGLYYCLAIRRLCGDEIVVTVPPDPDKPVLTARQRECLQWVRAGKTDWEIGQILGIAQSTVVEHLEGARRRLGVTTRTQAVIEAITLGIIHI